MKRAVVALIALVMVTAVFAGCMGGESKGGGGEQKTEGKVMKGSLETTTGWIDSSGEGIDRPAKGSISVSIPDQNIIRIKFTVSFSDSDAEHNDDDETPDDVTASAEGDNASTEPQSGKTPTTFTFEVPGGNITLQEGEYLGQNWEINVDAMCHGTKTRDWIVIYWYQPDEGIAYTLDVEYDYVTFEEE